MTTGGLAPVPFRTGASVGRPLESILQSLLDARGTAYDTRYGSAVWGECMASARAIWAAWEMLRRLSMQRDPSRVTDFLSRWESIFGVAPPFDATPIDRRAILLRRFQQTGRRMTLGGLGTLLGQVYPNVFVSITNTGANAALSHVVVAIAVPGGATITVGTMASANPPIWASSVHSVLVRVTQPGWMADPQFYAECGQIQTWVVQLMPAWCTVDWYRYASDATYSFILDDPHNLDNEAFGT